MKNEKIYRYILSETAKGNLDKNVAKTLLKEIKETDSIIKKEDIAIIGMAVRLPFANSLEEYWNLIINKVNCIQAFPEQRAQDIKDYLLFTNSIGNNIKFLDGAYLEDIDKFDNALFKVTPREASLMAPSQRIFLQTAYEAIEDAGYAGNKIKHSNTGVYVGYAETLKDSYQKMLFDTNPDKVAESIASNLSAIVPSRVSYYLDLDGPAVLVDTACSSSLVAVHIACKALQDGECEQAIVGGIKLHTVPIDSEFSRMGIESSDGNTRAFDENSDGAGIGEGAIAIMLKPISRAKKDRDHIYAVIKGSAVNQDGKSMGITAPNPEAQKKVIKKCWRDAGIDPTKISYIETHGTGTILGDPIEVNGITKAFQAYGRRVQSCGIGSVKSNIGHCYECSGLASLVKVVLGLCNNTMPPTINFQYPNERIDFLNSPIYVNTNSRTWNRVNGEQILCGVSSFGFSGTNCHLIVEEASTERVESDRTEDLNLLVISAESQNSLIGIVEKYKKNVTSCVNCTNLCYTAATGREHYTKRIGIIFSNIMDLQKKLQLILDGENSQSDGIYFGEFKIVTEEYVNVSKGNISHEYQHEKSDMANKVVDEILSESGEKYQNLMKLAALYVAGAEINWAKYYSSLDVETIRIPTYSFEQKRFWLSQPRNESKESEVSCYRIEWVPNEIQDCDETSFYCDQAIVIMNEKCNRGQSIYQELVAQGINVKVLKLEKNLSQLNVIEEKFIEVWKNLNVQKSKIIYVLCKDDTSDIVLRIFYTFIRSLKALRSKEITIDLLLNSANKLEKEEITNPIHSAVFGLFNVARLEFPEWKCRAYDLSDNVAVDYVIPQLFHEGHNFIKGIRNKDVYIPVMKEVYEITEKKNHVPMFIDAGVYIISGGLSEISLEIIRRLSLKIKGNFILLSRRKCKTDKSLPASVHQIIQDIESNGSVINILCCDVSDYNATEKCVGEIRKKFGKLNGVIHAAGVPGNKLLVMESTENFNMVCNPKIKGARNLDLVTREDDLDLFLMFSSVATYLPAPGQASYVAANAYLDAYASYRNSIVGKNTTYTINWCTWRDIGMGKRAGVNIDTAFKALSNENAWCGFEKFLLYGEENMLVGVINDDKKYSKTWQKTYFRFSEKLNKQIERIMQESDIGVNKFHYTIKTDEDLVLKGREDSNYTDTEIAIGNILVKYIGYSELYVYDNLFDLGVDSIVMIKFAHEIFEKWGVDLELSKFIDGSSIEKIAREIDNKLKE